MWRYPGDASRGFWRWIPARDEPSFTLVRSPNVLLATGMTTRLYNSTVTPGYLFNSTSCPACVGSGIAHALRAGARLVNMELNGGHVGPAYFTRSGKATWIGVYKFPGRHPHGAVCYRSDKRLRGYYRRPVVGSFFRKPPQRSRPHLYRLFADSRGRLRVHDARLRQRGTDQPARIHGQAWP